ncbi:MAG TPA: deoxyribodipyrimidine photo-lyase [Coriobacteriia bacterium]|nr:deoxyribodipyrimidine photo-lyase [Coriobacteriia bacterium]
MSGSIMWFRRDLRLADNGALAAAVAEGPVTCCVFGELAPTPHAPGAASRQWRAASIEQLAASVRECGGELVVLEGDVAEELVRLARSRGVDAVHCSRDWASEAMAEEANVREAALHFGISLEVAEGQLLVTPDALLTGSGGPFRVFTPYYRAWLARVGRDRPLASPTRVESESELAPDGLGDRRMAAGGLLDLARWWRPGEHAALEELDAFVHDRLADYEHDRDLPAIDGTSRLSPRLAHGEISPRQAFEAAMDAQHDEASAFIRQLAWRDFAYHVLHHFPHSADAPLRPEFERFGWSEDESLFTAWREGRTGFPLVDAGMRQLTATGWMHNRVRLVAGSFITKDLLVPWQRGEAWFREKLVDYDPALNPFNWQWVAGSGADAAPYFRIFNPATQAQRFDRDGAYVREWVSDVDGAAYPEPIVDHGEARRRALAAYSAIRS